MKHLTFVYLGETPVVYRHGEIRAQGKWARTESSSLRIDLHLIIFLVTESTWYTEELSLSAMTYQERAGSDSEIVAGRINIHTAMRKEDRSHPPSVSIMS